MKTCVFKKVLKSRKFSLIYDNNIQFLLKVEVQHIHIYRVKILPIQKL